MDGNGISHSKECRERIEQRMTEDPDLSARVQQAEERKTRYLEEAVERAD